MHLTTAIFMSFSLCAVCKMSDYLGFIWKNMILNAHKLPRILSALLVTVLTSFLIIFLLNIYLFVKNTLSSKV